MTALKSRWFLDLFLDGETVRITNDFEPLTLDGETYQGVGDRFTPPDRVRSQASLKSNSLKLVFDSSRQLDNSDFVGKLLDANLRRRQVRVRNVNFTATPDDGDVIVNAYGRINRLPDTVSRSKAAKLEVEVESGSLKYLERRMQTRTPANQKGVFPGDLGFDLVRVQEDKTYPWRTKETPRGTQKVESNTGDEPPARKLVFGEFVTEGSFVAHFTNQEQRKSWMRVFAIADCRIAELNTVWINGDAMISAPLQHGVRTEITALRSGGPRAWITFYDGRHDQVADPFLVSVESQWTNAHRLRGVAYVIIEHRWDSDLPNAYDYRFGGKGGFFYDRRQDSTAGGSGSQRLSDPSTWIYTRNAMVVADHYRQGIRLRPDTVDYWFGVGEAAEVVPYSEYADLADHCDEDVPLKAGGTQKRYEVDGELSAADDHTENLEKLASGMAARVIDQNGRIVFRPVREQAPVLTIVDGDLIDESETVFDATGRVDDLANTIEGRFRDAAQEYKLTDYPRVSDEALIDVDGERIVQTENFEFETSGERAQRLATAKLAYLRRVATLDESVLSSKVKGLEAGDWFYRTSALRGFTNKLFEVEEISRSSDGVARIMSVEVDPAQQAWVETRAVDLSVPPPLEPFTLERPATPTVDATPRPINGNYVNLPGVDISIDYGEDALNYTTEVEITRDDGTGAPLADAEVIRRALPPGASLITLVGELMPGVAYVYRARAHFGDRFGEWSAWQSFTSPAGYGVPASIAVIGSPLEEGIQAVADAASAADQRATEAEAAIDAAQSLIDDNVAGLNAVGARVTQVETTQGDQATLISAAQAKAEESETKAVQALDASADNAAAITAVDAKADGAQSKATQALQASQDNASAITQAETKADDANGKATLALQTANDASGVAASVDAIARAGDSNTTLVPNGYFNYWPDEALVPDGFTVWGGAGVFNKNTSNQFGRYALKIAGDAGGNNGVYVVCPFMLKAKYLLRVRAALNAGNWHGAQVYGTFRNSAGNGIGSFSLKLWSDADTDGVADAGGGGYRFWEKEIETPPGTLDILLYVVAHSTTNGGNTSTANEIIYQFVEIVPLSKSASDAKLALQASQNNASAILTAQTTADNANSKADNAQGTANGASANASLALSTAQQANGTLSARGVFQLDVNGRITGVYLHSTGQQGTMKLKADAIQMFDGSTDRPLFSLSGGQIYMTNVRVGQLSALSSTIGLLRTASSGARLEIENNQIRVYDGNGTLRVRLGLW